MPPVEIDSIPRDVVAPLKIVDKAMKLPLVSDTFNQMSKLAQPLSPYVETIKNVASPYMEKLSPMVESGFISIKTKAEENILPQLPEGTTDNLQAKLDSAMEQLASAYGNLDSLACEGLENLTCKVPSLKEATPELFEISKDTAASYIGYVKEYAASFTITQIYLKLGDQGLQLVTDGVKFIGLEQYKPVKPVLDGIKTVRRNARAIRRAGAKLAGSKPVKTIGEASILGAVAEIVGLNFFLSVFGLQLVPANLLENPAIDELDSSDEELEVMISDERLDGYVSGEDPDFVPKEVDDEDSDEEDVIEAIEDDIVAVADVIEGDIVAVADVVEYNIVAVADVVEDDTMAVADVVENIEDLVEEDSDEDTEDED